MIGNGPGLDRDNPGRLPASFGSYDAVDVLGEGGMGVVYRARHRQTGELVAVKTVSVARHQRLMGIRAEIVALQQLDHPQIVRIRDHGLQDGVPWYAMELLEGRTVSARLDEIWRERAAVARTTTTSLRLEAGPRPATQATQAPQAMPATPPSPRPPAFRPQDKPRSARVAGAGQLPEILRLFRAMCEPLGYLHGRGMVHRDIKPSNVFIPHDGVPVLMDFGLISRAAGSVGREELDLGGQLAGTIPYLAPEQVRRESLDARADLYALGCMLYEAITGTTPVPWHGDVDARSLLDAFERILPPSDLVSDLDPRLEALVMGLLAPERRARMGRADDVARVLAQLEAEQGSHAPVAVSDVRAYLYRPEIVGRDQVVDELSALIKRLSTTRRGRYAFLCGESGIGKTFLATEIARRATILGLRVVVGECFPPAQQAEGARAERRGLPLQPLRPLLVMTADYCLEGGVECTDRVLGEHGKIIASHVPALATLPGQDRFPEPPDLPTEENHRRLVASVLRVLAAYAAEGPPLLLVIDDLQWADELSLSILAAIGPTWLDDNGVLILGTYRSDDVGPELRALTAKPGATSLVVGRMDSQAVGQIAADMLAVRTVPDSVVRFLAAQAEGVPFFVAEYLRMALVEGLLQREAGRWTFKEGGLSENELRSLPLPSSIHELMSRRLGAIDRDLRSVLDLAAVIGREADIDLLSGATDASGAAFGLERAVELARELVRLQLLDAPINGRYRFAHDKLREAAYAEMAAERRVALHQSVGYMLEAIPRDHGETPPYGELAHHFTEGGLWDRAVAYHEKAGEQAFGSFAHHEAIGFFTSALSHAPRATESVNRSRLARWERHVVDSHLGLGNMPSAHSHAERALDHCGYRFPSTRPGWVLGFLGQVVMRFIQRLLPPKVFQVRSGDRQVLVNEAAYVLNRLCEPFFLGHKPLQAFYCGFRDLNLAERVPPSEALARGYATMAMAVGVGPLAKLGRVWSERAIDIARSLQAEGALTYCLARSGVVHATAASWDSGRQRIREAETIARGRADLRQLGETLTTLALLEGYKGDFAASLEAAEEVTTIGAARGDGQLVQWGRNLTVHALARLGRAREGAAIMRLMAEYHAASQLGEAEKIFDLGGFALTHLALGRTAQAQASASQVVAAIRKERFLPYFLKTGLDATCEVLVTLLELPGAAGGAGDGRLRVEAREIVGRLDKFGALYAAARPRALIYRGQLQWQRGARKRAFASWARALALAEKLDLPADAGRAHFEIGRRLDRGKQLAKQSGEEHVSAAGNLWRAAGATWELQRAGDLLARARAALPGAPGAEPPPPRQETRN